MLSRKFLSPHLFRKCICKTDRTILLPLAISVSKFSFNTDVHVPRRRRREGESSEESIQSVSRGKHGPQHVVRDSKVFAIAVEQFLERVKDAVEPMKQYNSVFQVIPKPFGESGPGLQIVLKPEQGTYILSSDEDMCTLSMISPLSGSFTYVLCSQTGNFVGMEDGHILEGMLVRDLIRQCHGLPKF
jgi:hypothetical protein